MYSVLTEESYPVSYIGDVRKKGDEIWLYMKWEGYAEKSWTKLSKLDHPLEEYKFATPSLRRKVLRMAK